MATGARTQLQEFEEHNDARYVSDQQIRDKLKDMLEAAYPRVIKNCMGTTTYTRKIKPVGFLFHDDNGKQLYKFSDEIKKDTLLNLAEYDYIEPVFQLDLEGIGGYTMNIKYAALMDELTENPHYFILSFQCLKEFFTKTAETFQSGSPIKMPAYTLLPFVIETILNRYDALPRSQNVNLKPETVRLTDTMARQKQIDILRKSKLLMTDIKSDTKVVQKRVGPILQRNYYLNCQETRFNGNVDSTQWKSKLKGNLKLVYEKKWTDLKHRPTLAALVAAEKEEEAALE